jgi:hypothetical protein
MSNIINFPIQINNDISVSVLILNQLPACFSGAIITATRPSPTGPEITNSVNLPINPCPFVFNAYDATELTVQAAIHGRFKCATVPLNSKVETNGTLTWKVNGTCTCTGDNSVVTIKPTQSPLNTQTVQNWIDLAEPALEKFRQCLGQA